MLIIVTWKGTSSNSWEYFDCVKGLGSSPMYVIYVLFDLLLILIICMIMLGDNIIIELEKLT